MNIWEERYTDERYGLEQKSSFRYFQKYIQQPYPRSIKKLSEDLAVELADRKRPPSYKTLINFSYKWKWKKRAQAYDDYLKQLHFKAKEKEVMEWESEQLKISRQRINVHTDTLEKIHNAPTENKYNENGDLVERGFPLQKKAYAESENQRAYNESLDSVYKLLYGGVIKTENTNKTDMTVDADVKQEIKEHKTIEELNEENKEYLKNIFKELDEENIE